MMTKFEVKLTDGSSDTISADGWTVREDRVLSVYRNMLPPEGLPPGTKRMQLIGQYNADRWVKVIQCDSVEQVAPAPKPTFFSYGNGTVPLDSITWSKALTPDLRNTVDTGTATIPMEVEDC